GVGQSAFPGNPSRRRKTRARSLPPADCLGSGSVSKTTRLRAIATAQEIIHEQPWAARFWRRRIRSRDPVNLWHTILRLRDAEHGECKNGVPLLAQSHDCA